MATKNQFKDDKYKIIHSDIAKIRARVTMYVSAIGEAGIFHLCKELIDNASDEALKEQSPCDAFTIELSNKAIRVYDNGRGIPTDLVQEVFETLQAGSNMVRSGGTTRGENGAASACLLALSSYLKIVSTRPQEKKKLTLVYKEAELVDRVLEEYNGNEHGLDVTYMPSKLIMGSDKIPVDMVVDWLKDFDYLLSPKIKVCYKVNGKEHYVHHKFLREYFDNDIPSESRLTPVLSTVFSGNLDEFLEEGTYHRKFKVECALLYANPEKYKDEDVRRSWMNMIYTPQNGSHLDGVLKGFIKFITEECVKRNKRLSGEDLRKDILSHLQIVVKADCDIALMFSSQAKHAVLHSDLGKAIEQACYEQLKKDNHSAVASIVEAILGNHRARIAGEQARDISKATRVKKQWTMTDKYYPPTSAKTEIPKELFLVEGDSAGGGVNGSKFPHQAILMSRGKSLNAYEGDALKTINSDSWRNLIPILGCGVGPTFDIKKLKFDKIIITTDADVDGYHIRVEYMTFFLRFLPEIIKAGKLYIAEPPLYQLTKGKQISYVATQNEYIQECIQSIGDLKLQFIQKPDNHISVRDFVTDAFNYSDILREISVKRSVNRYLLEHIAFGLMQYKTSENFIKNIDKWLRSIASIYKEIGFDHDTNQVTAVIDYIDQYVLIDDMLINDLSEIIRIQDRYGLIVRYESLKKNLSSQTELSHFFEEIEDMYPRITDRYKGLGSSDPEVLRQVVMDPRTRRLMRVTIEDALTYQKMGALVGKSKENVLARKEILMNFKWTQADIDS
jgi:DNA gyrase subunit B